jgi:hypothetical protein
MRGLLKMALLSGALVTLVHAEGLPPGALAPSGAPPASPGGGSDFQNAISAIKTSASSLLTDILARAARIDDRLGEPGLKERLAAIEDHLGKGEELARRLARRVEYSPGSPRPEDRIRNLGPFEAGHTYLVVRLGTSALERYRVEEIYGNGWLKVLPMTKDGPFAERTEVWLNASCVVMATRSE